MKKSWFLSLMLIILAGITCRSQTSEKQVSVVSKDNDVEVYYFHMTTRCATCRAVEAETRKNIDLLYTEQVKNGKISFTSLNLEEATGKSLGERFGVNSQTLLIVKGEQKINITNEGFLYAVSKSDKFKEVIKSKIDPLIK